MKFVDETNLDRKSGVPGRKMNCFECSQSIARPSLRVWEPFPLPARQKAIVGASPRRIRPRYARANVGHPSLTIGGS
jgi:hypothetical protein